MTIPKDIASEIADIGDEYIAAEMLIIEAVREFRGASTRFRAAQAEANTRMDKMRARVTHKIVRATLCGRPGSHIGLPL